VYAVRSRKQTTFLHFKQFLLRLGGDCSSRFCDNIDKNQREVKKNQQIIQISTHQTKQQQKERNKIETKVMVKKGKVVPILN
jgi:hypothetical protein